jgi:hypothetical protein
LDLTATATARLISFSAYDNKRILGNISTTISYDRKFYYDFTRFTIPESKQIFQNFLKKAPELFSLDVAESLYDMTNGHAGLYYNSFLQILNNTHKRDIHNSKAVLQEIVKVYIFSWISLINI